MAVQGTPELVMTTTRKIGIVAVSTGVYVGFVDMVACLRRFPIPFMITVCGSMSCIVFFIAWVAFTDIEQLKRLPKLQERAMAFSGLLAVLAALSIVYSLYNAVFVALEGSPVAQNAVVLVLPLLRLILRNVTAKACAYWEDLIPETTIFSVEVFNSMYTAQNMQSGNSGLMTGLIVASDLGSSLYTLHRIDQRARSIKRHRSLEQPPSAPGNVQEGLQEPLVEALTSATTLDFTRMRVLGSFPHTVPPSTHRTELFRRMCDSTATTDRFVTSEGFLTGQNGVGSQYWSY